MLVTSHKRKFDLDESTHCKSAKQIKRTMKVDSERKESRETDADQISASKQTAKRCRKWNENNLKVHVLKISNLKMIDTINFPVWYERLCELKLQEIGQSAMNAIQRNYPSFAEFFNTIFREELECFELELFPWLFLRVSEVCCISTHCLGHRIFYEQGLRRKLLDCLLLRFLRRLIVFS